MANKMGSLPDTLPPEVEEGNIEYKLKLVNPTDSRFEHLVTQMKWRLQEGQGEALYEIGVEDTGAVVGLDPNELEASLSTLNLMAQRLGAETSILRKREIESNYEGGVVKRAVEVFVRKVPDDREFIDLRLVVLGNVDAGKSTLLGVLTQGELDNGNGCARINLFRHIHEIESGRTSSISQEIMGFNSKGQVVNYSQSRSTEEILEESTKLITLIDLCGHPKYLKTTIFGLSSSYPDFAMLVVSATIGVVPTTVEHLEYAVALNVPIFVVVTKIDLCVNVKVKQCIAQLEGLLKSPGYKKVPMKVKTVDDAYIAASHLHAECVCPIFTLSNKTGKNLDLLQSFLNVLSPLDSISDRERLQQQPTEYQIDEVYSVPDVGVVVSGVVRSGIIKVNDALIVGPSDIGKFSDVIVHSIHRNHTNCSVITAGQAATLSLAKFNSFPLRRGMVLLGRSAQPTACVEFEASIYILHDSNASITKGFESVVHIGTVCQSARIIDISQDIDRSGQNAVVRFRFLTRPEFIHPGAKLLFRSGRTKGMGEVTAVTDAAEQPNR